MYAPLIDSLSIGKSNIHGYGIFAIKDIPKNTKLGLSHIRVDDLMVRTPLGGFYNHSNNPNCEKYRVGLGWFLRTIKDIIKGEEITATYTFYNIEEKGK
jgi:SET domain-containing protein